MLDEYLALGGVELGNNARAYDYASCLSCCAGLLKLPGCDGIHDATTGFTDAVREWQTQRTNLFTNPSFEQSSVTAEVWRNLILNPRFVGVTGWTLVGATAVDLGNGAIEVTIGASPPSSNFLTPDLTSAFSGFVAGDRFSASYTIQNTGTTAGSFRVATYDGTVYQYGPAVTINPGETKDVQAVGQTAVAGVAYMQPRLHVTGVSTGGKFRISKALAVKAPILPAYFDPVVGSGDPDLTAAWTGTVNNSASVLNGARLGGTANGTVVNVRSSRWSEDGAYSMRMVPKYPTVGSGYLDIGAIGGVAGGVNLERGKTYTAYVVIHKEQATGANRGGLIYTSQDGASARTMYAPNAAGDHVLRIVFTPSATGWGYLRIYHGGAIGEPDIWADTVYVIEGDYGGEWFDGGSLPLSLDDEVWRVMWTGPADASTSILQENVVVSPAESDEPPYSCADIALAPWYDQSNPFSRDFAGFYLLSVKGITDGTMTAGVTESVGYGGVIGSPHYATRSVRVRSMLVGCGRAATHYGLAWLKAALGESFCSRHGDACGTSDLAFFIDCPPVLEPGETDYAAATSPYRRYLHDVACTSSPIIQEEYETPSGAYVVIVEYILTAESPFVWGETVQAESTGAVLTAFDDIPFNLMRRPSGEQGDGVPAVVATQYAFNGSAEYGGSAAALPTGWARSVTNIASGLTDSKSSDIAAVGPSSASVRLLATGPVNAGSIRLYYDVALGSLPAGSSPSVSLWAAALTYAGAPVAAPISAEVEWRTASATVSTAPLGQIPLNGGNISAPGLTRPPTATVARIAVTLPITSAVAGDDIRLYADAFGLTVP
ncbi:minor tail protein [Microbacterium phage RobsFeet]|uniref:Minor tail protein n=1 Tax=Microbacterium phage RobsFeet TaxID=2201442 RepID=A0A2Z4Q836_9CAUD|nr:minor tail protein [Microbacterium phage RobsFeet]AWY06045.1 minor tail protein [Microbacterium phage RobsFeet]